MAPTILVTSFSITLQVKEFLVPIAGDSPLIFVLPERKDSAIFWISKIFRNRIGCSKELAREL